MFDLQLRLKHRLPYPCLGIGAGVRAVLGFGSLAATGSMVLLVQLNLPLLLLALTTLVGALYEETWIFSSTTGYFERRVGLVFWYRRNLIHVRDVAKLQLSLTRGRRQLTSTLTLVLQSGQFVPLDRQHSRRQNNLGLAAESFRKASGLPLSTDENRPSLG